MLGKMLGALLTYAVSGAQLELTGTDNSVLFGGAEGSGVTLRASCGIEAPGFSFVKPARSVGLPKNLTAELINVPATCVGTALTTPCATHDDEMPPLFWLRFIGSAGQVLQGPFHAHREMVTFEGTNLALSVKLSGAFPAFDELARITAYPGDGSPVSVNVNVLHGPAGGPLRNLTFAGVPGGNTVHLEGLPAPPPPTPIMPPPQPPSAPNMVLDSMAAWFDAADPNSMNPSDTSEWSDLSGNGITAARQGSATFDSTHGGGAVVMTGSGHYTFASPVAFQQAAEITIEAWVYVKGHQSTNNGIVTNFRGGGGKFNWMIQSTRGFHNNGFRGSSNSPQPVYSLNDWAHFALRYQTDVGYEIFVDTVKVHTQSTSGSLAVSNNGNVGIGAREDGVERSNMDFAVVRMYNRALTLAELQLNYAAEKARFGK